MSTNYLTTLSKQAAKLALLALISCSAASAQQTFAMLKSETPELPAAISISAPVPSPQMSEQHKFWDRKNRLLFAAVAGSCAADFAVTYSNLQNGGKELNPMTRVFSGSTAGLALNFAGETAGVTGLSYFFHKTGHHRLERLTPLVNIGASAFAVSYGLAHR